MKSSGARHCDGGCNRLVSSNKSKCLACLTLEAKSNLEAKGVEVDDEDLQRLMRVHAVGGH